MDSTDRNSHGPRKLSRSRDGFILYNQETLDQIFSSRIESQLFFKEAKAKFAERGLVWEDKLLLDFDSSGKPRYADKVNSYVFNSDGYRSKEFDGSAKLLYAGCSTTFGTGVPEDGIWGSMVAAELGVPYVNISKQGTSSQWIVKNILAYFDEYGHPDTVCCLFPDLYRMTLATNNQQLTYGGNGQSGGSDPADDFSKIYDVHLDQVLPPKKALDYSKKPHDIRDVLPSDMAVYFSIQSILMLDQYCRSNGIKFIWSTWDVNVLDFIEKIKSLYPSNYSSFLNLDLDCWVDNPDRAVCGEVYLGTKAREAYGKNLPATECHLDLAEKYGVNFYRGMDDIHGIDHTHPGVHQHAHIAEAFTEALRSS